MGTTKDKKADLDISMNDDYDTSVDEKLQTLNERAEEIQIFINHLNTLKNKLEKKKTTIKDIIAKKIEDNQKELMKWQELLYVVVDESLDEKINKLESQASSLRATHKEMKQVLTASHTLDDDESDSDDEDPKLEDLLALELDLQPEGLTESETIEMESRVKTDFNMLLNEPKKTLRRTFTYVGGIIRGYLRRGKSNINWIKIMRTLEGREFEDRNLSEPDPFVGSHVSFGPDDNSEEKGITSVKKNEPAMLEENVNNTWNSMTKLFENRHNQESAVEFCQELYKHYDTKPEDVEFYLPQLCNLLLNQFHEFQPLKKFILDKCKQSVHFALQMYLIVRASKESRVPPKKKKTIPPSIIKWRVLCNQLLTEIQNAVALPSAEDVLQYPIQFMDNLVAVSKHLTTVPSNQYQTELAKQMQAQDNYLKSLPPTGFAYIPLMKQPGTPEIHRVVRIPPDEAYPIPTYGRVLYHVLVEVIDFDEGKSKLKKKKKKKDKLKDDESRIVLSPSASMNDIPEEIAAEETGKSEKEATRSSSADEIKVSPDRVEKKKKKKDKLSTSPTSSLLLISPLSPTKPLSSQPSFDKGPVHLRPNLGFHSAFGELWEKKAKRIKKISPHGSEQRWHVQPMIVKWGEEVLQEEFAMQLIVQFQRIFYETGVPVKVISYRILAVSSNSGLIEPIPNCLSLDKLKKQHTNLLNFFIQAFGETSEPSFKQAQMNFVKTMAAYSILCYILQIKDRHNGNILLDASGHVIHIDFGYFLSKTIQFEKAPFKLTTEFMEVMGGLDSPVYKEYCRLCVKAYLAVRKHYKKIMMLVEMTMEGKGKKVLPCLQGGQQTLQELLERFHLDWSKEQCEKFVMELVEEARGNWRTIVYDAYQLILNNIH